MSITLQGTTAGFSAEFIRKLPALERAMAARGLEPDDFIISKDDAVSANARPIGPFFFDYTVFVGDEHFTVTEPNDMRFLEYLGSRILAPEQIDAARSNGMLARLARWMAKPI